MDDSELSIGELLQLELHAIEIVIDAVDEPDPLFVQVRTRLLELQDQLRLKRIHPEYAEVQLEAIRDQLAQWQQDHRIPED